jgi:hypothetical protein
MVWELNSVLRGDRPLINPWGGMYTQIPSDVTLGIIILSNFMRSLHRVNKLDGVERGRGLSCMFACLLACISSWTSEWVTIWFWNSTPHIMGEFDGCRSSAKCVIWISNELFMSNVYGCRSSAKCVIWISNELFMSNVYGWLAAQKQIHVTKDNCHSVLMWNFYLTHFSTAPHDWMYLTQACSYIVDTWCFIVHFSDQSEFRHEETPR